MNRDEPTMTGNTGNTASTKLRQRRKVSNITEQFLSDREMLPHRKNVTKQVLKFKRQKCIHPLIGPLSCSRFNCNNMEDQS